MAERYQEIDCNQGGGVTFQGMELVLDDMGVTSKETRRFYRALWRGMSGAASEVMSAHYSTKRQNAQSLARVTGK